MKSIVENNFSIWINGSSVLSRFEEDLRRVVLVVDPHISITADRRNPDSYFVGRQCYFQSVE